MKKTKQNESVLVINQDSRKALAKAKLLLRFAKQHKIKAITCMGADLDHVIRQELTNKHLTRLIIAGGDGSLATAASLVQKNNKKVVLAVIPVGTANCYARTLGIKNLSTAFAVATSERVEQRRLCQANGRVFLIGAGIGVTSRMFEEVSDDKKRRLGKFAYTLGVIRLFTLFDPMRVTITANGQTNTYATTEVQIINQSVVEWLHLQPKVHSSEPFFEIVTYGIKNTKLSPIFALVISVLTLGRNQKYLKRIRATRATITTDRNESVSIDGDSIQRGPLLIELVETPVIFATARRL